MRFWGSESGTAHRTWYRRIAEYYDSIDAIQAPRRAMRAGWFLHDLFRRSSTIKDVLDVACGTFSIDLPLAKRGYRLVGRDVSPHMIRMARRNVARAGVRADLGVADMRTLDLGRQFDAVLCLGSSFHYMTSAEDIRRAFGTFRRHLRPGALLVIDLANFDAWIRKPRNARVEADYRAPDGTRIAVFAFNDQNRSKTKHVARFITVLQHGRKIELEVDEAMLKVWTKDSFARALRSARFEPFEWWGDLAVGATYRHRVSSRLVAVARRL